MTAITNVSKPRPATAKPSESGRSYWTILSTNLFSFFNIILFSVGIILLIFGRYSDALITVSAGIAGTLVNTFHEIRAKRQLDQISLLVRPEARVIRDGIEQTVDATQLRLADAIHLRAGDQALADGTVVSNGAISDPRSATNNQNGGAEIDESLLTGESDSVRKRQGDKILSGSFCISGDLIYRAEAVGADSFASKLTQAARTFTPITTPLQRQVIVVLRLLMVFTVCMALVFVSTGFIRTLSFLENVAASAVLIGLIPYGLFLTINLAYTLGAVKIAKAGALVQQTNAVESLYYVDVLCMDKTGTLTTNALQLQTVQPLGTITESQLQQQLGDFVHSVSATNATSLAIGHSVGGQQRTAIDEVAFASARKWSALAFEQAAEDGAGAGVFVLGALEMLQPHLAADADLDELQRQTQAWSDQGLRVLLFAHNPSTTSLHDAAGTPTLPLLEPIGLISLRDELRPQAREMLSKFTAMGVNLKIISGDNPRTVAALAQQLGIVEPKLVSGPELAVMSDAAFAEAAKEATIFGRIAPEQKARLVEALIKQGHYVAMIGDGVNDILALKKANLGIAMQSGSSAARNVADIVLLADSYAALAPALTEGKRIINGLTNAVYLLITRSLTYAFAIIGVMMVGLDFPFEPAQAGVTALTVGLPAFFLTLWARPDAKQEPLLRSLVRFVLPIAVWSMLIGVSLYAATYFRASTFLEHQTNIHPQVLARFEAYTGVTQEGSTDFTQLAARIDAQTTLSVFLSLCALLLILFLEPPVAWLASWRPVSPDRRPAWLALGLIVFFVAGLYIPAVANYLGFLPPFGPTWRMILIGLAVWVLGLSLLWRGRWIDRMLALDV